MSKTKADLERELAAANEQVAALRDLLDAISEAAAAVPVSAPSGEDAEMRRYAGICAVIHVRAGNTGRKPASLVRDGARAVRARAAEPLGYEPWKPKPCPAVRQEDRGEWTELLDCGRPAGHPGPHHAAGSEGREVAWDDEPAAATV